MSEGEVHQDVQPRIGEMYMHRPPHLDCKKCWPQYGWGHRPTRKGKVAWEQDKRKLYTHHIKGPCFFCAGTGLVPIPMEEVFRKSADWMWNENDADNWGANK